MKTKNNSKYLTGVAWTVTISTFILFFVNLGPFIWWLRWWGNAFVTAFMLYYCLKTYFYFICKKHLLSYVALMLSLGVAIGLEWMQLKDVGHLAEYTFDKIDLIVATFGAICATLFDNAYLKRISNLHL